MKDQVDIQLITHNTKQFKKGILLLPAYMAKGIEFDAVLIYNASAANYARETEPIGLMKAVESYTPDKKTRLATYAARCIENEILMHLRTQKKVQKDVSLFEPIGTDKDGNALQIRDLLQCD
ncbi:sigma factor, partial [Lysinibacillus xylanilyticus]|uniref:sigma factor n=1 Tax=Lysinibacillus xylanilyticus TaxID=582475 RepID=UPI0022B8022F